MISPLALRSSLYGVAATAVTAILIVVGSRRLEHFDAALVGYTFATLFSVFAVTYRYSMWLQRPPTALYWRRGWQMILRRGLEPRNFFRWTGKAVRSLALNDFIFRRGFARGLAHWLIMAGCVLAVLITFPLVFGWLHFTTVPGDFDRYIVHAFGFPLFQFKVAGPVAFLLFHGLVWSSFLVIGGVMLAMKRRMTDAGAAALQSVTEDILPLVLLFAVSITGLMLTASYTWMKGYGYDFLALFHAVTVIVTLLWLPFGKLFHVFQRPAQLGVAFYKDVGTRSERQRCLRCDTPFASRMHVEDLAAVESAVGYDYRMEGEGNHYQQVCPRCRRLMLGIAQGELVRAGRTARLEPVPPDVMAGAVCDLSNIAPKRQS